MWQADEGRLPLPFRLSTPARAGTTLVVAPIRTRSSGAKRRTARRNSLPTVSSALCADCSADADCLPVDERVPEGYE
ncbi:hypothetical protein [Halorussus caseinilyticus]|nr:hypothetical protein [Halorussus sp. DT72]